MSVIHIRSGMRGTVIRHTLLDQFYVQWNFFRSYVLRLEVIEL